MSKPFLQITIKGAPANILRGPRVGMLRHCPQMFCWAFMGYCITKHC